MTPRDRYVYDTMCMVRRGLVQIAGVPGADINRDANACELIESALKNAYDAGLRDERHASIRAAEKRLAETSVASLPVRGW